MIRKPLLTEKSSSLEKKGVFSFVVSKDANKPQIKRLLEKKYKVVVGSVRIVNTKGKKARVPGKRLLTQKSTWKKAYVQILSGTIDLGK